MVWHGHALVAIRERADHTVGLVFDVSGRSVERSADLVVLALPFIPLRDVELKHSGLSCDEASAIRTMGRGTYAKIHLELSHKTWPALGYSGATYGEWQHLACGWDDTVQLGPDASPALYLAFPGGASVASASPAKRTAGPGATSPGRLKELENVFPGTTAAYTGRAYEDHWAKDPWVRGAYSYYRVGQANDVRPAGRQSEVASCSPASTPRSTTSASSTGQSNPANAPRAVCSAGSVSEAISGRPLPPSDVKNSRVTPHRRAEASIEATPRAPTPPAPLQRVAAINGLLLLVAVGLTIVVLVPGHEAPPPH